MRQRHKQGRQALLTRLCAKSNHSDQQPPTVDVLAAGGVVQHPAGVVNAKDGVDFGDDEEAEE